MEFLSITMEFQGWSYKSKNCADLQETPPPRSLGTSVHYNGIFVHYDGIPVHYEGIIGHYDGITMQYHV